MNVENARDLLDTLPGDGRLQVEINGTVHDVHDVRDDSQGVYFVVDKDQEEREMR